MKYQEFKIALNKPYFSQRDIVFNKLRVYNSQLSLWRKKGYIGSFKRGFYFFADRKDELSALCISHLLYEPSYLSLEFALSHYGLIPEMVYANTAVTTKTTRTFSNTFGHFVYRHIHPTLFFGYTPIETPCGKYLMAEPEKALLDYLYFHLGKINDKSDIDELRINMDELKRNIDRDKLRKYLDEFHIKKLEKIIGFIFEIC